MKVLRTPDDRFENLAGFPYEPNYLQVDDDDGGTSRAGDARNHSGARLERAGRVRARRAGILAVC